MRQNRLFPLSLKTPFLPCLFLFLLFCTPVGTLAETGTGSYNPSPVERSYKQAKDYYYRLLRDTAIQKDRLNWLKGASEFRKIYLTSPRGKFAPNCLFMLANIHYRMYLRFKLESDLEDCITYYRDVWLLFPDNSLADDAMFWTAEKYKKFKGDRKKAAQLYARQIKQYPQGDKYAQAVNRLRELGSSSRSGQERLAIPPAGNSKVKVLPVQYWSSDDYSRIVIRSSGPVTYSSKLAESAANGKRKLTIDFAHASIDRQYTTPVTVRDGLLQQIHSGQQGKDTVRIALTVASISTYKIFSLNDPFRVIVDIHGQQKILSTSKTVPTVNQERISRQPAGSRLRPPPAVQNKTKQSGLQSSQPDKSSQDEPFIVLREDNKRKPSSTKKNDKNKVPQGLSLAQQLGLGVKRIVIDPGHGGKDPGAMGNGLKEKNITLDVGRRIAEVLRSKYRYEVILTRENDRFLPLEERTAIANTRKADLFVSIHVNAHPDKSTRGVETFFLNLATNTEAMRVAAIENATSALNISDLQDILTDLMQNSKIQESSVLAEYVQNQLISGLRENSFPTTDHGVKQAPFYVLIGAEMPAVLAEISFISNKQDAERLRQDQYLEEIAGQIAAGVAGYAQHQATAALQL